MEKELFAGVEIDTTHPPYVFKAQLYDLTGVPPERQKIMVKGGLLKDDADWSKLGVKEGQKLMMMGTTDEIVKAPEKGPVFMEDLREEEQVVAVGHSAGLFNLGNTCYMNSTVQCLHSVPELKSARQDWRYQLEIYKRAEGFFGLPMAIRQSSHKSPAAWWSSYGKHTPELQNFAIRILSLTCSSSGCERNWSKLNDLVFVKYNRALKRRYELRNVIDPISLNEIDDSNEWLSGKVDRENDEETDDYVFSKEDGLTYRDVAKASGAGESRYNSRHLIDESEDEEDEIEFEKGDKNPNQDCQDEDFDNLQEEPEDDEF
ncbi:hypothetical protein POM88_038411 [Heracleum sosnowskyi]|uniref:ubiquitinyl hydrolase 1 n=1 Tax=Heracleum sosnowskyi TaxID=360622 RepID=A0AAD8M5F4_9APIA|nr:hypothetical protein POM88_038411 [Heracleum sosnowskyi]